jgi:hypothetical protein
MDEWDASIRDENRSPAVLALNAFICRRPMHSMSMSGSPASQEVARGPEDRGGVTMCPFPWWRTESGRTGRWNGLSGCTDSTCPC